MVCRANETDVAIAVKMKNSGIFKASEIFLPIAIFLVIIIYLLAYLTNMPILVLINAFLLPVIPLMAYYRLAFLHSKPNMPISDCLSNPNHNLALCMNDSAVAAMLQAEKIASKNNSAVNSLYLIQGMLEDKEARELFIRLGLFFNAQTVSQLQTNSTTNPAEIEELFKVAIDFCHTSGGQFLEVEDLFVGLAKTNQTFKQMMNTAKTDEAGAIDIAMWHKRIRKEWEKPPFWEAPVIGGFGQDWAYGYTNMLSQYALNITRVAQYSGHHIELFSRSSYVETMENLLAKGEKNNVLLVGDYGVGKKTLVTALAQKITSGAIHPSLRYKQIMQVNVGALLAGSQGQGDIAQRIEMLIYEASKAGNIILFFDNFHAMVSSEQGVGYVNATEIILPFLQRSPLQIIGSTTIDRYHKDIETATGMSALFERIDIPEPDKGEALKMLEETVPAVEGKYGVVFIYQALNEIVKLSERYIHDKPFPQKSLDLAIETAVKVSTTKNIVVTDKDVQDIISSRTHVPVGEVETSEKDKLLNLENILHKRVIGQEEAVSAVANAMRRSRSGLSDKRRPIGTFLFVGPTGVGKTEMAKALAEAYFGDEKHMIRFDMSEYQDANSIYNLIGSPAGPGTEGRPGALTSAVHDNPFSLLLLDELEKANPKLLTLFLQVFDDGRLTGGNGKTIDFTNTIIISTSNAGSEIVRQYLASGQDNVVELKTNLLNYLQENGIYSPEFINRFDGVIAFRPLKEEEIAQVAGLMIADLNRQLSEKGISVAVAKEALDYLVKEGYDPVFGARPMRRVIQEKLENVLAKKMLTEKLERGTVLNIGLADINQEQVVKTV